MADDNNQAPAAAAAAPVPPVAVVMPAPPPVAAVTVCLWAAVNAAVFCVVALIADHTRCTKWTWVFQCLALSDKKQKAAAELRALFDAGLWCSLAAELAALLHMMLTDKARCTSRGGWAVVDALAWLALAATAGLHCTQVASGIIVLRTAHPEDDTYFYVHVLLASLCLLLDLIAIAGLLLCCSPRPRRRHQLCEQV